MMRGSLLVTAAVAAASSSSSSWLDGHKALVRGRTRGAWAALLANYSAVQRAQRRRDDGRYVVAFADNLERYVHGGVEQLKNAFRWSEGY